MNTHPSPEMSLRSREQRNWRDTNSDWRLKSKSTYDYADSDSEDLVDTQTPNLRGKPEAPNYSVALGQTLDADRLHAKEELFQIYTRLQDEVAAIEGNFKTIEKKLKQIIEQQEKQAEKLEKQEKKLTRMNNKLQRSSGLFANICKSIPFVGTIYHVLDGAKEAWDTVQDSIGDSPNMSLKDKIWTGGKALMSNVLGGFMSFF